MLRIIDIEGNENLGDEAHPGYTVTFDDGTTYDGITADDGYGGDGYDTITYLRIGDEFSDMGEFLKYIH